MTNEQQREELRRALALMGEAGARYLAEAHAAISSEEAGMPYGDKRDGMLRWFEEAAEAARLQREAEAIRERLRMMADFRKAVQKRRR